MGNTIDPARIIEEWKGSIFDYPHPLAMFNKYTGQRGENKLIFRVSDIRVVSSMYLIILADL